MRPIPQSHDANETRDSPCEDQTPYIQIIEGPIAFIALREVVPTFARAWVGYLAREKLVEREVLVSIVRDLSKEFPTDLILPKEIAGEISRLPGVWGTAACVQRFRLPQRRRSDAFAAQFAWRGVYTWRPAFQRQFVDRCRTTK